MLKEEKLLEANGESAAVSIKDWLILDCLSLLNLIPVAGSAIYLVIILILGFGTETSISVKNRIKAALIWAGIWIVILTVAYLLFSDALLAWLVAMGS